MLMCTKIMRIRKTNVIILKYSLMRDIVVETSGDNNAYNQLQSKFEEVSLHVGDLVIETRYYSFI
jgi:hypothetical protein